MLEVAIVGGGLCGLALANRLNGAGRAFALFEVRPRLGGRILSVSFAGGMRVDLGPTWYWPQVQPLITRLVADLGLTNFAQHDTGEVLRLTDPEKMPASMGLDSIHGGARRLEGGMTTLVEALADALPEGAVNLGCELTAVLERSSHVELQFRSGDTTVAVPARHAVLAVPPRLLEERIHFAPVLDAEMRAAMRATPTWMADQAKVVIGYQRALWREAGYSGNAFIRHPQAVLGEIFDACDASGRMAALGGFLALTPALRERFREGLPILMGNQMLQVFSTRLEEVEQHYQDWAAEPYTCSMLDGTAPEDGDGFGHPLLRKPLWGGRLRLGGAETAAYAGGVMEGALESAAQIARELDRDLAAGRNVAVADGAMRASRGAGGEAAHG